MSEDCPHCINNDECQEKRRGCFEGSNYKPKPLTNAGRIRSMTDEELAKWIANDLIEPGYYKSGQCEEIWLEWLKQEAQNE